MTLVSAEQLAQMRAIRVQSLYDTCEIRDPVPATNAGRGQRYTWPAVNRTVACNVIRRQVTAGGEMSNAMVQYHWEVVLPYGTVAALSAHITPTTGAHAGKTFEVLDVVPPGTYDNTTRVAVAEVS